MEANNERKFQLTLIGNLPTWGYEKDQPNVRPAPQDRIMCLA